MDDTTQTQDFMAAAREETVALETEKSVQEELKKPGNKLVGVLVVLGLVLVVGAGMSIWLKPWEKMWESQDKIAEKRAGALANDLSQYFLKRGAFPWNYPVGEYAPAQRRPESAFAYLPKSRQQIEENQEMSRDWLTAYMDVSSLSDVEKNYWRENDEMYVLKQVSSGNKVVVCFVPQSDRFRAAATEACAQDELGRRDAPYEIAGFDACARIDGLSPTRKEPKQNLFCVAVSAK